MTRTEAVRQIIRRFNKRRADEILQFVHPDIEIVADASRFAGQPFRGYDGLRTWLEEGFDVFDEWSVSLDEVDEHPGARVLAVGTVHARGRESGAAIDLPCAWVFDFDGELTTRMETFPNRIDEARATVG